MRKIGGYLLFIVFLIFVIPIIILGGVGKNVSVPKNVLVNNTKPNNKDVIKVTTDNSKNSIKDNNSNQKKQTAPTNIKKTNTVKKNASYSDIAITVYYKQKNKIIKIGLEEYLKGVISSEMPASFNIEALKAQAIAARTFAIALVKEYHGCAKHKGADVCSEVHCQVWMPKEVKLKGWPASVRNLYWKKVSTAVDSTRGMVLEYNGSLAKHIKYHSNSGGKTEDSINVFGYSEPYLKSVVSPNENEASSFISRTVLSRASFINSLKKMNSKIAFSKQPLQKQIVVKARTTGGRVKTIRIGNKLFTGVQVRKGLNLKSACFTIRVDKKNVYINVRGYGHGVGMSQWGANEMGKRGKKYDYILKYYYHGTQIKNWNMLYKNSIK